MRVSRTGDLAYRNDDGSQRIEVVTPETLFDKVSYDSLKMKPVTLRHPPVLVNSGNARDYQRGMTGNLVYFDGDFLGVVATVTDRETIDAIKDGVRETSCGYTCDVVPRADGKFDQRNRQYNHVAIVERGRAGDQVRVHFDGCECWSQDASPSDERCECETTKPSPRKPKMDTNLTTGGETFQIDVAGRPVRVDAETYTAIRAEQKLAEELRRRIDELERQDAKKPHPPVKAEEELFEEEDEEKMDSAALRRRLDELEGQNMGLQDRIAILQAHADAKAAPKEEDDEEEEMDVDGKKMDVADLISTWELTRERLLPEIKADRLDVADISDATALKRAYLLVTARDTSRLDDASDVYIEARFDAMIDAPAPISAQEQLNQVAKSIVRTDGAGCDTPPKARQMKKLTYGGN